MRGGVQNGLLPASVEGELNLGAVAHALWRKKGSIIGSMLMMVAAAIITVNALTPRYKSEARILVEGRENVFLRPEAEKASMDRGAIDQETLTSQVQLVLSRELAREVIAQLKLTENPEFNAALIKFSPLSMLRHIGLAKDPLSMTIEERSLAAYYDRLSVFPVDKSRVIVIEFQSADPELAARAANAIAEKYLVLQQVAKQNQARSAGQWLLGEIETLRSRVSEAEAKVEEFRAKSNLFIGTNNTGLSNQQLTELSSQVSSARAQKVDAEARARLIREALRTGQALDSLDVANSELIRRLSEQRVTLRAQLAEQSSTLLPLHPRIKEMKAQVADLDQQIREEGGRLVRSLESEAKVAGARLETLSANLDLLKRQTASTSDQDVLLRALEREAKAQRDLLESYLAKYRETSARDNIAAAPADARVISRAVISNVPYFPKKGPIILIAALGTLCLSSAFVVTGVLLSGASYRSAYAHTRPDDWIPSGYNLAEVPSQQVPLQPTAGETPMQAGPTVDDVALAMRHAGEDDRRVAVIGCSRNVNTTSTAVALARTLSKYASVVLVDLSLGSPNTEVISNEPNAPGIADLLQGAASFSDIITRDRFSRVHLVAAGQVGVEANSLINSEVLLDAIDALAKRYDYLVINAGVKSQAEFAPILAMAPHATLVGGATAANALATFADQLRSAGFAKVTILAGSPPWLDHAAIQSTAA